MPNASTETTRPLRLWPGVVAAALLVLTRVGIPVFMPEQVIYAVIGGFAGAGAVILWWVFFSRAPWLDRLGAVVLMIVALAATWPLVDVSISTGAMGGLLPMLALPPLSVAFVVWAVVTSGLANGPRRATMAATIFIACGVWVLAKTGGFTGSFDNDLMWRWAPSQEERLVADPTAALPIAPSTPAPVREVPPAAPVTAEPLTPSAVSAAAAPTAGEDGSGLAVSERGDARVEWPGFRGPRRDGTVRGTRIDTDWTTHPPAVLWRRPIGPGWSSFAVHGDMIYTQEQRGDDEIVAAYHLATGKPVWSHHDKVRFWESNGGAGPRATPTLDNGRVYAFGATGILNALDARTGALAWTHNVASDTHTEIPMWGFASSPVVAGDVVIVAASSTMAGYDVRTGNARWVGPRHDEGNGYSSPQRMTIDGVEQIVLLNESGATSVAPADGKLLWEHALPSGARIVQPAITANGDVLMSDGEFGGGNHMRRIAFTRGSAGWTSQERWASTGLKPSFNDFVVHKNHVFGFDGSILACIDLETGQRVWKGGRYGSGQLVLLADQDLLLVTSEEGELALVSATPDKFTEIARIPAIEGKTWNHPVLIGDILLVRNGEEMAAFRLTLR